MMKIPNRKVEFLGLDDLVFDPQNPRLPEKLKHSSEDEVINYMLEDANLLELMTSIAEQGFFDGEPLLVVPSLNIKGKFEVVEGNRRLTAVKVLNKDNWDGFRKKAVNDIIQNAKVKPPSLLPVLKYENKGEIMEYLGYRHITGVKEWDSIAKARYMRYLFDQLDQIQHSERYKEIARIIGSKPNYVARIIAGLGVFDVIKDNEFFGIKGIDEDGSNFSLLTTAMSYREITRFIGLESNQEFDAASLKSDHLKSLTEWIYKETEGKTRIGESRNLSKLAKIVASPRAMTAFASQGRSIDEAILLTDEPKNVFSKSLNSSLSYLASASGIMHLFEDSEKDFISTLNEIRTMSISIRTVMQARIDEAE